MAGSGCCYCAGGGGAMVFTASHPLGPWKFQVGETTPFVFLPLSCLHFSFVKADE